MFRATAVVLAVAVVAPVAGAASAVADQGRSATVAELVSRAEAHVPSTTSSATGVKVSVSGATASVQAAAGKAVVSAVDARNSLVRAKPDGVQALAVLRSGTTAKFNVELPAGVSLRAVGPAGALAAVDAAGKAVGLVDAPWAVDATGKRLSTSYTVTATSIVQHVDTTSAVYPVVADPYFRWYSNGVVVTLTPSDMWTVVALGSGALLGMLLYGGISYSTVVKVLWLTAYTAWYIYHHQCYWFWFPYWSTSWSWGTYSC